AAQRARRSQLRIRAARARAGDLGREQPHRADRARARRHGLAESRRNRRGAPMKRVKPANIRARLYVVAMVLALTSSALVVRAVDLQVVRKDFYQEQGDQRFLR